MWSFMSAFFHLACFLGSSLLQHVPLFLFFYSQLIFHCLDLPHFYSSADEHLDCFCSSAIMNSTAMNIHAQVFVWPYIFISFRQVPRNKIAGSNGNSETASLFTKVTVPFCNPTNSVLGLQFLHILVSPCYCLLFLIKAILCVCMVSHCGFGQQFPDG